jgi:ABC-type multidrug transport system ATPase subunit/ABC-type multidrug transport system permease subunit
VSGDSLVVAEGVSKRFAAGAAPAIDRLSARIEPGRVTGLVGPDAAGKTTLMRLMAGLLLPDEGRLTVCGADTATGLATIRRQVNYVPQRFGLYEDLSVLQNLNLYADLRGVVGEERARTFGRLLSFTGLASFTDRLAGKLSGGMKQKLGLACALIHVPRLLLLDEPSAGVDPLSRRELWRMVNDLAAQGIGVVWSTSYLDEAERCGSVLLLNEGRLLYDGPPKELTARLTGRTFLIQGAGAERRKILAQALKMPTVLDGVIQGRSIRLVMREGAQPPDAAALGAGPLEIKPAPPRFEDAFVDLLGGSAKHESPLADALLPSGAKSRSGDIAVEVSELTKRFGDFTAADRITFRIGRGEIFGLLGPNGAGKSTTFKMMCGLLRPTSGLSTVAGYDLYRAASAARARLGYVAQKFSLYGDLSVRQNLDFFAGIYGPSHSRRRNGVDRMTEAFALNPYLGANAGELPLGFKQRLALACAIMHDPDVLFLDEPTSGVDPLTRREFWSHINAMVERGVTVMVTTHFLDEAEYCDRIGLIYQGRVIAEGSPDDLKDRVRDDTHPEPSLEDAFIALVEGAVERQINHTDTETQRKEKEEKEREAGTRFRSLFASLFFSSPCLCVSVVSSLGGRPRRIAGLVRKEFLQILRDPSSYLIAVVLPLLLLLIFGYGVSLDLRRIPVGLVVEQSSPEADSLVASFRNSRFFTVRLAHHRKEVEDDLVSGRLRGVIVVAGDFADQLGRGQTAPVQLIVDGSDPNTSALVENYAEGVWQNWLRQESVSAGSLAVRPAAAPAITAEPRFWFNPEIDSRHFLVPGSVAIIMTLIGTLLTALVVAREWERGTMEALLASPIGVAEFLLGKLIPYFVLGMTAMGVSAWAAVLLFGVPFRGSVGMLLLVSSAFLAAMLPLGLLISTVTRNQFAASEAALISAFMPAFLLSGFLFEIDSMPLPIRLLTRVLPARFFVSSLQTLFLAGDVTGVLMSDTLALLAIASLHLVLLVRATRMRLE